MPRRLLITATLILYLLVPMGLYGEESGVEPGDSGGCLLIRSISSGSWCSVSTWTIGCLQGQCCGLPSDGCSSCACSRIVTSSHSVTISIPATNFPVSVAGQLTGSAAFGGSIFVVDGGTLNGNFTSPKITARDGGTISGDCTSPLIQLESGSILLSGNLVADDATLGLDPSDFNGTLQTQELIVEGAFRLTEISPITFDTVSLSGGSLWGVSNPLVIQQPELAWNRGAIGGPAGVIFPNTNVTGLGGVIDGFFEIGPSSAVTLRPTEFSNCFLSLRDDAELLIHGLLDLSACPMGSQTCRNSVVRLEPPGELRLGPGITYLGSRLETSFANQELDGSVLRLTCGGVFGDTSVFRFRNGGKLDLIAGDFNIPLTSFFVFNDARSPLEIRRCARLVASGGTDLFGSYRISEGGRVLVTQASELASHADFQFLSGSLTLGGMNARFLNLFKLVLPGFGSALFGPGTLDNRLQVQLFGTAATDTTIKNLGELVIRPGSLDQPSLGMFPGRLEQLGDLFVQLTPQNLITFSRFNPAIWVEGPVTLDGNLHILPETNAEPNSLYRLIRADRLEGVFDSVTAGYRVFYSQNSLSGGEAFLVMGAPPVITLTQPLSGEFSPGEHLSLFWEATGDMVPALNALIELIPDGAEEGVKLASLPLGAGGFHWNVASHVGNGTFRIRVSDETMILGYQPATPISVLSGSFTITGADPATVVAFASLDADTVVAPGSTQAIDWISNNPMGDVSVSVASASFFQNLGVVPMADGTIDWILDAGIPEGLYRVQIQPFTQGINTILSDRFLVASDPNVPSLVSTVVTQSWTAGTTQSLTWSATNPTGDVQIGLYRDSGTAGEFLGTIGGASMAAGMFEWEIPSCLPNGNYRVQFLVVDVGRESMSDVFTVIGSTPLPVVDLTTPAVGEIWDGGTDRSITWTVDAPTGNIMLLAQSDTLDESIPIGSVPMLDGAFVWSIPSEMTSGDYRIVAISTACDAETLYVSSSQFGINARERVSGDFDDDLDSDMTDFGHLQSCFTGQCSTGVCFPPLYDAFSCSGADMDGDGDVDHSDHALFGKLITGPQTE